MIGGECKILWNIKINYDFQTFKSDIVKNFIHGKIQTRTMKDIKNVDTKDNQGIADKYNIYVLNKVRLFP